MIALVALAAVLVIPAAVAVIVLTLLGATVGVMAEQDLDIGPRTKPTA